MTTPTSISSSTGAGHRTLPGLPLDDVTRMAARSRGRGVGLHAVVDAMPADTGRNATKLAELSRLTGIHVVAPTGLQHERFYVRGTGAPGSTRPRLRASSARTS